MIRITAFDSQLLRIVRSRWTARLLAHAGLLVLVVGGCLSGILAISIGTNLPAFSQSADDDAKIAKSLASMLRAGRTVISRHQDQINDPILATKA